MKMQIRISQGKVIAISSLAMLLAITTCGKKKEAFTALNNTDLCKTNMTDKMENGCELEEKILLKDLSPLLRLAQ